MRENAETYMYVDMLLVGKTVGKGRQDRSIAVSDTRIEFQLASYHSALVYSYQNGWRKKQFRYLFKCENSIFKNCNEFCN